MAKGKNATIKRRCECCGAPFEAPKAHAKGRDPRGHTARCFPCRMDCVPTAVQCHRTGSVQAWRVAELVRKEDQ